MPLTAVSATSTILFQVFGAREEPKAVPIAIVEGGTLAPITLDAAGWRLLDSLFFSAGGRLPIYRNGADVGTVEVVRGMWSPSEGQLYQLKSCRLLVPQALMRLQATTSTEESVEFLASSTKLLQRTDAQPLPRDAETQGRTLAGAVAAASEIGNEEVSHLDFIARWLRTGAGAGRRTLLASYIDPNAGDAGPGAGHTVMLLALAEDSAGVLSMSYKHVATGEGRTVEFQRLANHADLDGDGVDEIILEAWHYASVPELTVLKYSAGKWTESFRVSENWCLDRDETKSP